MAETPIVDDTAESRFELTEDGNTAVLEYRLDGRKLVLTHTGVPDELGGRGLGGRLVRAALGKARAEQLAIEPLCPFARSWLRKHPDEVQGVPLAPTPYG
jgi:predicted GNAT family acetyltransferase